MSRLTLGNFAASGSIPGSYEYIATATGTGSSPTITFSSIPQGYTHLQIRGTGVDGLRNTSAGIQFASSVWRNTSAIDSISIYQANGNWFSNTQFALYGIK